MAKCRILSRPDPALRHPNIFHMGLGFGDSIKKGAKKGAKNAPSAKLVIEGN
jgi:hypothetical protein